MFVLKLSGIHEFVCILYINYEILSKQLKIFSQRKTGFWFIH